MFSPVVPKTSAPSPELEEPRSGNAIVCALPGWAYARALAIRAEGDRHAPQVGPRFSVDKLSRKLIEPDVEHRSFETSGTRVSVCRATLGRQSRNWAFCRGQKSSSVQDIHTSRVCRLFKLQALLHIF